MKNVIRLWVDKEYAKAVKIKAAQKNMRIVDYTKFEAQNILDDINKDFSKKNRRIKDDFSDFYKI